MQLLGSEYQVNPWLRGRHLPGRVAACGLALLVAMSVIALRVGASPSSAERPSAERVPQPVRLPSPLPTGSLGTVVLPARADSPAHQHVRAVALPRPLVAAPRIAEPSAALEDPSGMDSPEIAAAVAALALVIAGLARSAIPKPARPALAYMWRRLLPVFATLALAGCGGSIPAVSSSQPSDIYLENTLDWIQEHALPRDGTDWESIRRDALAMAMHPQTTAETYPAIRFALSNLRDSSAFFLEPREFAELTDLGVTALYPGGTVVFVQPHSPAAAAGVREGDTLESVNGDGLRPHGSEPREGDSGTWFVEMGHTSTYRLALRPADQTQVMTLDVPQTSGRYDGEPISRRIAGRADALRNVGYIELPWDGGWADYATRVQRAIRAADSAETCSWIVDVRRNIGGDFWTYVAGVGPILGEDDLGGFSFPSGARERWAYEGGKVLWDGRQRDESYVADPVYTLKHRRPPVAVLTSRATFSAGELLRVAFQGRSNTRSFGEPTGGKPVLQLHTTLSDGAHVSIGAAYAFDRTGRTYTGPVSPDETVTTDWARFGGADDPVVAAALAWLRTQSGCGD